MIFQLSNEVLYLLAGFEGLLGNIHAKSCFSGGSPTKWREK